MSATDGVDPGPRLASRRLAPTMAPIAGMASSPQVAKYLPASMSAARNRATAIRLTYQIRLAGRFLCRGYD